MDQVDLGERELGQTSGHVHMILILAPATFTVGSLPKASVA